MAVDGKVRRQPSRGMYVLPSLFTAGNMAAGFYAITQSIQGSATDQGYFDRAALALGIAVLFDGLDGNHRAVDQYDEATLAKSWIAGGRGDVRGCTEPAGLYLGFSNAAGDGAPAGAGADCAHRCVRLLHLSDLWASRLARFNISVNPQPRNPGRPGKKYFVGMPIPAGAGVISSVIHFQRGSPIDNPWIAVVWLCLLVFTSFLMVSNWRFWSAKEVTTGGRHPFQLVAVIVLIGSLIVLYSEYMLIILAMAYLVSGVVARLAYSWSRGRRRSTVVS